ncbi:hypothetical protein PJI17_32075, partial [Mycobacterium kansasii]
MLQEDSEVVVPVLDSFSNLNLDDQLQEQVLISKALIFAQYTWALDSHEWCKMFGKSRPLICCVPSWLEH